MAFHSIIIIQCVVTFLLHYSHYLYLRKTLELKQMTNKNKRARKCQKCIRVYKDLSVWCMYVWSLTESDTILIVLIRLFIFLLLYSVEHVDAKLIHMR